MLKGLLKDSLAYDDSPCVVAWDTHRNKAAGFILNHTFHVDQALENCRPPIPYSNYSWDKQWLQPIQDLEHYKHYLSMSSIFADYRYKKIMKAQIGCTGPDYTNQKVMSRLYQKGVEQVQACKGAYDAIVGESTNKQTYRLFQKFDFELLHEFDLVNRYPSFKNCENPQITVGIWMKRL
ncbi:hypothetical protein EB796_008164 [Bugula neritina]|uniref:Uncharacterized protein n=1 Tax=Bugula neritina TaxID=10212 RepID=A0A7J7K4G6_BUGNE|nr:hypothetical protein EB796_008164 [Bugula neritina]